MKLTRITLALAAAFALVFATAIPASASILYTGAHSCNSGYEAFTKGFYRSVGKFSQYTGSWHTAYLGSSTDQWISWTYGNQSYSQSYVQADTLQAVSWACA